MMKKAEKQTQQLASEATGLKADSESRAVFGDAHGFKTIVLAGGPTLDGFDASFYSMLFAVKKKDSELPLTKEEFQTLKKENKEITKINVSENIVQFIVSGGIKKETKKEKLESAFYSVLKFLIENDYESCCEISRSTENVEVAVIEGDFHILSNEEYTNLAGAQIHKMDAENTAREKVFKGILFAFIGAVLGGLVYYLFASFGRLMLVSGIAISFLTLYGYKLGAGKLTKKGIAISAIFMLGSILFFYMQGWVNAIVDELGISSSEAWDVLPYLAEVNSDFSTNLVITVLALGVISIFTTLGILESEKTKKITYRLG